VVAMDIEADEIKLAKFNATLNGVQHKIKLVVGDFFATGETMKADIVVTSPSCGREYWIKNVFPLGDVCGLHGGAENIICIAKTIAPLVLLRLPTKASIDDVRIGFYTISFYVGRHYDTNVVVRIFTVRLTR